MTADGKVASRVNVKILFLQSCVTKQAVFTQAKISTSETEIKALTDRLEASERLNEQLVQRNRDLEISAHLASQAPHAQPASTVLHHASLTVLTCCVETVSPCLDSS